jgi:hypothetical protein
MEKDVSALEKKFHFLRRPCEKKLTPERLLV